MLNITNQQFFIELGFPAVYYDEANKKLNEAEIRGQVAVIIVEAQDDYPGLKVNLDNLKFDSLLSFLKSYIEEIKNLNYQ
jgi:hypothetical protein